MITGGSSIPGVGSERSTFESELLWGTDHVRSGVLWNSAVFSGAGRDAGNTPTSHLRPGLIMGKLTSSGEREEWDADASDGTQDIVGVLDFEMKTTDFEGSDIDRWARILVARAPLKAKRLFIQGLAFVGHIDEYLARRALAAAGCVFDDDPMGYLAGQSPRQATVTGVSDTLTAAETGTRLFYSNAAAVAVTLPAVQAGLSFDIVRTGDEEIVVSSAEGDNMIVGNDLSADSITFTTAGNHIGAYVRVEGVYVGTTLKWLVTVPHVPLGTGLAFHAYALGT